MVLRKMENARFDEIRMIDDGSQHRQHPDFISLRSCLHGRLSRIYEVGQSAINRSNKV